MQFLPVSFVSYVKTLNHVFISPDEAIKKFTVFKPTFFSVLYAIYFSLIPSIQTLFGTFLQDPATYDNSSVMAANIYRIVLYPICLWLSMGIIVWILSMIFKKRGNFNHYLSGTGFILVLIAFIQFFIYLTQFELDTIHQANRIIPDELTVLTIAVVLYYIFLTVFIFITLAIYSFANYVFAKASMTTYGFGIGQQVLVIGISAFIPILLGTGDLLISVATYIGSLLMYGTSLYAKNPIERALFPALYKDN